MGHKEGNEPETVIAAGVKVEGDFVSQGDVLIEGMVEGSLRTERDLRVGERASISAEVTAANAVIAGELKGNLSVAERLELQPTARVSGDVSTKVLVVAGGAQVNGKISMGQAGTGRVARTETAEKSEKSDKTKTKATATKEEEIEEEKRTVSAFFTPKG